MTLFRSTTSKLLLLQLIAARVNVSYGVHSAHHKLESRDGCFSILGSEDTKFTTNHETSNILVDKMMSTNQTMKVLLQTSYDMETRELIVQSMISWVRSKGGYFNPKLEIRKLFPGIESSPMGVFARENIESKEDLIHIPRECYIEVTEESEDDDDEELYPEWEDQIGAYRRNLCLLTHKLIKEMKLEEKSDYSPYTSYLRIQSPGQLPTRWSKEGRDLLNSISRPSLHMTDWMDVFFIDARCITTDPFEEQASELIVQRSFDTAMIPLW